MHRYLRLASRISVKGNPRRKAHIGCVGRRSDGALVFSWNGCSNGHAFHQCPSAHAEARLVRKLDIGSEVWVARVRRDNGLMALAKPCAGCAARLKSRGVLRCTYSISENEFGVLEF